MKKRFFGCLILVLLVASSMSRGQEKIYPHLQIFLLPSQPGENTSFITFWDGAHKLAAGPFPIKLLERVELSILLDVSYSKPDEALPSAARLKIQRRDNVSSHDQPDLVLLDQAADFIANRGVSKMFPDGPFVVIGHNTPLKGVLQLGNIMEEIQRRLLACDKEYRKELDTALDSLKEAPFYRRVLRTVESRFPRCPVQRSRPED